MTRTLLLAATGLMMTACPHKTRPYQPAYGFEQQTYAQTNRHVYPNDVRFDFARGQRAKLAWTGIVRGVRFARIRRPGLSRRSRRPFVTRVYFTIEHRYFDWLETLGSRKRYVLSSRGEGTFTATWDLRPGQENYLAQQAIHGMAIVYGTPVAMDRRNPVVRAYHVQLVHKGYLSDDGHYGRPARY